MFNRWFIFRQWCSLVGLSAKEMIVRLLVRYPLPKVDCELSTVKLRAYFLLPLRGWLTVNLGRSEPKKRHCDFGEGLKD